MIKNNNVIYTVGFLLSSTLLSTEAPEIAKKISFSETIEIIEIEDKREVIEDYMNTFFWSIQDEKKNAASHHDIPMAWRFRGWYDQELAARVATRIAQEIADTELSGPDSLPYSGSDNPYKGEYLINPQGKIMRILRSLVQKMLCVQL